MLVIGEAHYLLASDQLPGQEAELINWLMTACSIGVPVALVTTSRWDRLKGNTEKHPLEFRAVGTADQPAFEASGTPIQGGLLCGSAERRQDATSTAKI